MVGSIVDDRALAPNVKYGGSFAAGRVAGGGVGRSRSGKKWARVVMEVSMQTGAKSGAATKGGVRHRLDIDAEDGDRLDKLAAAFQVPRSEVVRRLIRAASECGPALSKDGAAAIAALTRESRAIEFQLREFVARRRGGWRSSAEDSAVADSDLSDGTRGDDDASAGLGHLEPLLSRLLDAYAAMNRELNEVTVGYGSRLRSLLSGAESAR